MSIARRILLSLVLFATTALLGACLPGGGHARAPIPQALIPAGAPATVVRARRSGHPRTFVIRLKLLAKRNPTAMKNTAATPPAVVPTPGRQLLRTLIAPR